MADSTYIEYTFTVNPLQPTSDILIAQLGEVGFESFVETEEGLLAYIKQVDWSGDILTTVQILQNDLFTIKFTHNEIAQENWNASWESNFNPIIIDGRCTVRAPFHARAGVKYDIVIMPKMSFGTGHHETTYLMLQHILNHDMEGKAVLDMGSGTGVLAILAAMRGAASIDAIDIDHWSYLNAQENVLRNGCSHIQVYEGGSDLLTGRKYDIIIANINRNILLKDIPTYAKSLHSEGILFLSGFYEDDIALISSKCNEEGLGLQKKTQKNEWISLKFVNS